MKITFPRSYTNLYFTGCKSPYIREYSGGDVIRVKLLDDFIVMHSNEISCIVLVKRFEDGEDMNEEGVDYDYRERIRVYRNGRIEVIWIEEGEGYDGIRVI